MFADMQEAALEAQAEVTELMREVMQEMVLPQIARMAKLKWAKMTPEEKEQFKNERPDEYKAFMQGEK